jgi:hypothetical protein
MFVESAEMLTVSVCMLPAALVSPDDAAELLSEVPAGVVVASLQESRVKVDNTRNEVKINFIKVFIVGKDILKYYACASDNTTMPQLKEVALRSFKFNFGRRS